MNSRTVQWTSPSTATEIEFRAPTRTTTAHDWTYVFFKSELKKDDGEIPREHMLTPESTRRSSQLADRRAQFNPRLPPRVEDQLATR